LPPLGCHLALPAWPVKDAVGAAQPFILDWLCRLCYLLPFDWRALRQSVSFAILPFAFSHISSLFGLDFLFAGWTPALSPAGGMGKTKDIAIPSPLP
jgi:hypothetical protein